MSSTRRAAAPRQRRTTSEQQILDATTALLSDGQRLPDIAVHDIINAAGVSRSTFYQYFASKTELAFRLAAPAMTAARAAADRWWREPSWGSSDDMVDIVRALIAQGREHRLAWLAVFDVADRDPEAADGVETLVREYVSQMAERITAEQRAGNISDAVDAAQLGRLMLITTRAAVLDHLAHGDPGSDETFSSTLGRVLWLAVRQP
ncbi:TetR/AcrR family transcriptional regulator [Mycolicibacterium sp. J2]|jgi:AcrR family transcriptional regulator|uniref:TetR/AcrR family transcriptional regulator n=1 Tax=Mycolicibacterium sp. J2 TaxID=2993511 RepID=UPI00224B6FB1|nr:TetR/AcrR family transcriptional regulator [Mycolicibacterium sp. J2]MCX2713634.1 TetR/AcrR family transcriptional regulator [Mycolicibacterium sp. J2]